MINTKLKKVNVMNDAVAKAFLRSKEARMIVASFLSEVTGIDKSVLMNATYTGGEIPKRRNYEKNKESDVMILIDELNRIIIEVNQFNTENLYRKNTEYAMASILEMTKRKSKRDGKGNIQYPKVILVSLDNFNSFHTKRPILTFLPRDEEGHIENDLYQSIHIILDNAVNNEYNKDIPEEVVKFAKLLKAKSIDELVEEFEGDEEYMEAVGKAFLRSKEARMIVASFLSEVTGIDKSVLMNATYTGGEIPKRRNYEKNKESDVMILIDELNRIIIEVNQFNTENLYRKNTEYAMASILEMTKRKSKRDGKGNIQYPKVILVSLDNFNSFHTKRPILTFLPRDEEGHIENDLYQSIHIILDNAVNNEYNKDIPEEVVKFAKLLKAKSIDELVEEFEGDEEYMEAVGKLEELVMDPDFAGAYDKGPKPNGY